MTDRFDDISTPPFVVHKPDRQSVPFVLNSPHSGRIYLDEFLASSKLTTTAIRSSEDFLVDELVAGGVEHGIPLLAANFPRAYLDVNREPYELDQAMFDGELPAFVNKKSVRVSSGLGTIARIVAEGREIYNRRLTVAEALERIEQLYKPYHAELRNLLAQTHVLFGCAALIDCHSMPSSNPYYQNETRPDIVLGDRFGASCAPSLIHMAREILVDLGFRVALNKPYAGGFITEHYGRPESGLHALQIEINRGLYMHEHAFAANPQFGEIARSFSELFQRLSWIETAELLGAVPLAAE